MLFRLNCAMKITHTERNVFIINLSVAFASVFQQTAHVFYLIINQQRWL